jgi:hypothetical protein
LTEQQIRSLSATTTALVGQTDQIRASMDEQCQKLVAHLTDAVTQMDKTSDKLQQVVATATLGADRANERFSALTENATTKIGASGQEILNVAAKTESSLSALSSGMTQQVAALNLVSEQLAEQHKAVTVANEGQSAQLVGLFEKLGNAHAQASEVAERTIARLGDALQQIQKSLSTMNDQSQTTVANVTTAGQGFANQADVLLSHAQAAEQQARTVLAATGSLQEQAKQLRETLNQEGARTSDVLGALLAKLAAGSTELRDLGGAAEGTLTSLQVNVNQQAAAFGNTMQQISERQRALTTSLDAQRDVMNGLLVRLTLAQDETAATAERSVARLTDSSLQIAKQLESIDS